MTQTSVIREFLVALGFKVDAAGLKRFENGIKSATVAAVEAGKATTIMATAVTAAVTKVSKEFEDLYYASIRLNSSVENIRATDYAISQMGGSARGARAAMEAIAAFMRDKPGGEGFIRDSLGVGTRQANGELRDTADIMKDLADRFRQMPYYMAKVRANFLGIDDSTLQAMIRGTGEFSDKYHEMSKRVGVDQKAAAEASHQLMTDLRTMLVLLTLVSEKIIVAIQPAVSQAIKWFMDLDAATNSLSTMIAGALVVLGPFLWLLRGLAPAASALATALSGPVGWVLLLVAAIGALLLSSKEFREQVVAAWQDGLAEIQAALKPLMDAFADLGKTIETQLSGPLEELRKAFLKVAGPAVIGFFKSALHFLATDLRLVGNIISMISDLLNGRWSSAWKNAGEAAKNGLEALRTLFFGGSSPAAPKASGAAPSASSGASAGSSAANPGANAQIQAFLRSKGFSQMQTAGIAAGIWAESKMNPNAVNPTSGAYGIGQWLGSRKAELFRRYGNRPTLQQQLEFLAWELNGGDHGGKFVRDQNTAHGTLDAYVRKFMRPGEGTDGDLSRGSQFLAREFNRPMLAISNPGAGGVSITQKTDINISGGDAYATGRAVANEQGRVNGDLVRNTRGAVA